MFTTLGYLYNQIHPVVLGTGPSNRWYRMYYAKAVKLIRGVDNPIKFKIRNQNQKDVNLTSNQLTLYIVDAYTREEKLSRTLDIEDAAKGLVGTVITEEDLNNLDSIRYHYGIKLVNSSNSEFPIYVDDNYGAIGVVEVATGAYPGPVVATELTVGSYSSGIAYTSVIAPNSGNNGVNTAAYYLSNFTGTVTVQGHLEDSSSVSESDYIDITSSVYTAQNSVVYTNFTGLFSGIRFKITKTTGSVDKILYKN